MAARPIRALGALKTMDHYHVGIVVTDMDAASAKLSNLLGVSWGPIMSLDAVEYRNEAGEDVVLPTTMRYSTGTPCLELILEVPGSVWVRNESSNLHHIGFWSDSMPEQSNAFSAAGCPLQLCGRAGDAAPTSFAYHRDNELGIRVELVNTSMRDGMQFLFEPQPPAD
jgi:catechol 2,3-dioxygenase-like lactoylglutathione lyase family enzyme